ncbi:RNA polymerase sigma factor, sigma-70 family [Sediminibacillus albus]|uniref:RNA polymerase sigma factor, sigma-70 family n=1 Tax=Sediminibacillus albus TaxID=407036 RepID=A0A1G8ZR06_9BACI|nr:RNA polymerase sigma factor, sigma-70 family [Sediminibacillus albus]
MERHKHQVFKIAMSVLHDEKAAEDAAQETFIKMVDSLPSYQFQGFKTWISRIALHKAIDARRKKQKEREDFSNAEQEYRNNNEISTEEVVLRNEKKALVQRSIEELPEKLRYAVRYYYLEELSYTEIAKRLNLAEKTVEMRLYRARKWMKAHWKEGDF